MKVNRHTYKKNPYIPPIIEIEMIEEAGALLKLNSAGVEVEEGYGNGDNDLDLSSAKEGFVWEFDEWEETEGEGQEE